MDDQSLLREAHRLTTRALRLQNQGRYDEAERLLDRAERLIDRAERIIDRAERAA